VIEAALHGERLDRALAQLVPELSRSYLQQLIADGAVRLRGVPLTKASHRVRAGEAGDVELRPTPQSQAFVAQDLPLTVVYEDEHLLVVDKPAGLVVHPAPGNWSGTLLNALLARDAGARMLPRAGIVHRLDKDTSGLMVVARTRATMDRLVAMIAARDVSRQYLALAHRHWEGGAQRRIDAPIGRDPRNRLRMAVVDLERGQSGKAGGDRRSAAAAGGGRLRGAVHPGDRPHPPDPRPHGAHRPSAGGGSALWRRRGGRPAAPGAACVPAGVRASGHGRVAGVPCAVAGRPARGVGGVGAALQ
jgi:RluA family pseudouridine synthase